MPKVNVTVPHALGTEEARARIQGALADAKTRYADRVSDLSERWEGDRGEFSGRAMGFKVSGTIAVRPDAVEINGDLPLAASMFKGQIEAKIRERASQLLASEPV
jgi:putative polyhydroxyalkanoate system protein